MYLTTTTTTIIIILLFLFVSYANKDSKYFVMENELKKINFLNYFNLNENY